jgi:hypothetical protein
MARNEIKNTLRHGGALFMPGNEQHADMLAAELHGRSCRRLLDREVVSGPAFEKKAKAWEKDNKEAADEAKRTEEVKATRREASSVPWAHAPGEGNTSTNEEEEEEEDEQ